MPSPLPATMPPAPNPSKTAAETCIWWDASAAAWVFWQKAMDIRMRVTLEKARHDELLLLLATSRWSPQQLLRMKAGGRLSSTAGTIDRTTERAARWRSSVTRVPGPVSCGVPLMNITPVGSIGALSVPTAPDGVWLFPAPGAQ